MQPCNTVMAEPTSSKMDNTIALTTQASGHFSQSILPAFHRNLVVWMLLSKSTTHTIR